MNVELGMLRMSRKRLLCIAQSHGISSHFTIFFFMLGVLDCHFRLGFNARNYHGLDVQVWETIFLPDHCNLSRAPLHFLTISSLLRKSGDVGKLA
jgi:hypothetical protein